jgi:hypothetical protein
MSDVIYKTICDDMTWSYSRLSSFDNCKYKWFLSYILDEKEAPMFYAQYGSFIHSLLERYYKGELPKEQLLTEFLLNFSTEVQGERPPAETVQKYIRLGTEYFRDFQPLPIEVLSVEEELHFDLDGHPFVAFLDLVGIHDGKIAIIDHKSRDLKPRSTRKKPTLKDQELDEMLRQLYLYAYGLKQVHGDLPDVLCFNCFKNGQFIEEKFSRTAYDEAIDWAKRTIGEISEEEDFQPDVDYFKCKNLCGFHDRCCYFHGR